MPGMEAYGTPLQVVRLAADGQAYNHPCLVWFAHVMGTAGATCSGILYDGFSTSDRLVMTLVSTAEGQADFSPVRPVPFLSGLYIDVGAGATEVVVGFDPLPES